MNCSTGEECSGRDAAWADPSASMLLFNSDQDYEATVRLLPIAEGDCSEAALGQASSWAQGPATSSSTFYVNNPEIAPVEEVEERGERQADLLGLGARVEEPGPELLPNLSTTGAAPTIHQDNLNLLEATPPPSGAAFDFLGELGQPAPPAPTQQDKLPDLMGAGQGAAMGAPLLDMHRVTSSPNLQQESSFDPFGGLGTLTSSMSNHSIKAAPAAPMRSTGPPHQPPTLDPFAGLGGLGGQQRTSAPAGGLGGQQRAPAPPTMGPNYSRSFFQPPAAPAPAPAPKGSKAKVSREDGFGDLLGGFQPTAREGGAGRTIGQMKKAEAVKDMSPDEAKIMEWKEGKARNIRTLLCSLHKVLFAGTRWTECGMHQLVSAAEVKKMYRKACLAVHPDKQMGTENENLSKLIFMELNEAWSEFENDPSQQNMFG